MSLQGELRSYTAGAAIAARRIVKFDSADNTVIQAAAATDLSIGVSEWGCSAAGDQVDIVKCDLALIEFGGTITRGQPITSDANGKAVAASPATGVNHRIIGFAEVSGVSGDIGEVWLDKGYLQG